ncbi:MAG: preprotein translocase subunit SecA, partial [Synergistetes bacterium]|nr:preprotein translocase subunit SecA [Synergistota bacterium]
AKEGVKIEKENQTLATITFQNYFRMYKKLAGMTGTAATEAEEFNEIYNLDVYVIPTHKPMIRIDHPDVIYKTKREKFNALVGEIVELYEKGRPVLVGTSSIEKSELISKMLKKRKVPHQVLNAKYHEKEAEIIAQAGRLKAVTIATNMAGRGTDILLGGNPEFLARTMLKKRGKKLEEVSKDEWKVAFGEAKRVTEEEHKKVVELGGLHIIGAQRHESRRIDNQLRGRAGRQGDPGSSRFYLSLEDDLLRLFGSDKISGLMERLGMKEGDAIEHPWISKAIENAQRKVEEMHFEARKYLLAYDNVMNSQREVIYNERRLILQSDDLYEHILEVVSDVIYNMLELYVNPQLKHDEWNIDGLFARVEDVFPFSPPFAKEEVENYTIDELHDMLFNVAKEFYAEKRQKMGIEISKEIEKMVMLQIVDMKWKDHLHAMDDLRQGIGLRAYAHKDPLVEYQIEAYNMFEEMVGNVKEDTVRYLFHIELVERQPRPANVYFPDHMPSAPRRASHRSKKRKKKARRR